ncbi:unnamed protein product [Cylicostephanus goldi]|uniref:Uncharacterized protein n=1 Tax=Cylicostephanus goldi TaxID=71465 RepID=A0A3P7N794_CYLGO|nr:unnamed protein product [Cylicostephanus goldi]
MPALARRWHRSGTCEISRNPETYSGISAGCCAGVLVVYGVVEAVVGILVVSVNTEVDGTGVVVDGVAVIVVGLIVVVELDCGNDVVLRFGMRVAGAPGVSVISGI